MMVLIASRLFLAGAALRRVTDSLGASMRRSPDWRGSNDARSIGMAHFPGCPEPIQGVLDEIQNRHDWLSRPL